MQIINDALKTLADNLAAFAADVAETRGEWKAAFTLTESTESTETRETINRTSRTKRTVSNGKAN